MTTETTKSTVWANMVDKKYRVSVERTDNNYKGILKIELNGTVLHSEEVTISFGGPFGPDVGDVALWEGKCIKFIDDYEAKLNT